MFDFLRVNLNEEPIRSELYSHERLDEYALFLANELEYTNQPSKGQSLVTRMNESGKILLSAYKILSRSIHNKETLSPAAEWLVDSFHIIEDQIREIKEDLPPTFYRELPKLTKGELKGYPRIYAIALVMIAHTDSHLEPESMLSFLKSFQKNSPFSIGELWAIPITLRLVLIENLRRIVVRILMDRDQRNQANIIADKLIASTGENTRSLELIFSKISIFCSKLNEYPFIAQLTKRLRDQTPNLWAARVELEKNISLHNLTLEQIVHKEHQNQAANQITIANIITSMRLLSSLNWQDFFEDVSLVDAILVKDPSLFYERMDFLTRDSYRHSIERLAKHSKFTELQVAQLAINYAKESVYLFPTESIRHHVGYFLIGTGVKEIEKESKYRHDFKEFILRNILTFSTSVYFSFFSFFLIISLIFPIHYFLVTNNYNYSITSFFLFLSLILIPISDLSINILNFLLTHLLKPKRLPKLDLKKGVPEGSETMVVIPCLLINKATISNLVQKIEIHFLSNSDPNIFFALLTDFKDFSDSINFPEDNNLLDFATHGIKLLNTKYFLYKQDHFFIFHRKRLWNSSQKTWMGWERKRGKIQEFNNFLRGSTNTSFSFLSSHIEKFPLIKYVITLDSDTQLPRDSAKKLIGTIIHPLNKAIFHQNSNVVKSGFSIIQPRMSISLESSAKSVFAHIFSGFTGIDPYTTAVSDVYQDLFNEGIYTGKGLYDVDAFEKSLTDRMPENSILSHDLIEGLYGKVALVTDVELIDDYPNSYATYIKRQHRWVRGDWQLLPWLISDLPIIAKWKIIDNLRRSLVAPSLFIYFISVWIFFPGNPLIWTLLGICIIAFPALVSALNNLYVIPNGFHWPISLWRFWGKSKFSIAQLGLYFVFLPNQAYIQTDAIIRSIHRTFISKTNLLEWMTAAQNEDPNNSLNGKFNWEKNCPTYYLTILPLLIVLFVKPNNLSIAIPMVLIWISFSQVALKLAQKIKSKITTLNIEEMICFRLIGRRTWNFFDSYVGAEDNWLPPDNFQIDPRPLIAHRTSPTNIGLYAMALVSARDLGYINSSIFLIRVESLITTIQKLVKFNGHLYNWYDTKTLEPLYPKYISVVDSGNLAGHLIVLKQACLETLNHYPLGNSIKGFKDTITILEKEVMSIKSPLKSTSIFGPLHFANTLKSCQETIDSTPPNSLTGYSSTLRFLKQSIEDLNDSIVSLEYEHGSGPYESVKEWLIILNNHVTEVELDMFKFTPWIKDAHWNFLSSGNTNNNFKFTSASDLIKNLNSEINFFELSKSSKQIQSNISLEKYGVQIIDPAIESILNQLRKSELFTDELIQKSINLSIQINQIFEDMSFHFLLAKDHGVFSIGYNVTDAKHDKGIYDLLASESRMASFVAIAKGDLPQEHWFQLGRNLVPVESTRALISWSASMFEYLMPNLVMRDFENTLIGETLRAVVQHQIQYGKNKKVPWGISEAGFNARDLNFNYQYGPFGVPGLGLKRGLNQDLVISPYSTLLAAMINPKSAYENIQRLINMKLLTNYGFYESIDYTVERIPENEKFAIIKSFMAHHQGMTLVAINNIINNNIMQNRFHDEPLVKATQLLLQERIPENSASAPPRNAEIETDKNLSLGINPYIKIYSDANFQVPRVQLLSNRNYSLMISTAGSGYSKLNELFINRWREDTTCDAWGNYIFIKNKNSNLTWSSTYQPLIRHPDFYQVTFGEDKVKFFRRDNKVTTQTEIIVAPEDNVEIRQLTLSNQSDEFIDLDITSYLEPVLAKMVEDNAHPAFSKLFIETESMVSRNALFAKRRKRSSNDKEIWVFHVVAIDNKTQFNVEFETSRQKFIGRGRTLLNAKALTEDLPLSNSVGATLDPILSLRVSIRLQPHEVSKLSFSTGISNSYDEILTLADRYHDIHSFERESHLAWTKSQVDLLHFGLDSESAYLFQRLAERVIFSDPSLRPPSQQMELNTRKQSELWPYSIGGDLPIVVVRICDIKDINLIRKLLRGHEYLRLKGLIYDFVILNDSKTTYLQELQEEILWQVRTGGCFSLLNKSGGIYTLRVDAMPSQDSAFIQSIARVVISADWGSLREQLDRKFIQPKYPKLMPSQNSQLHFKPSTISYPELTFNNGIGGFNIEGTKYIIILRKDQWTPAPWINVISTHSNFGFQISESGSGFTWSINSRENRISPWFNDPVSDPTGEAIYIRDEMTSEFWSATPLPIRGDCTYIITHGYGYSSFAHESHGLNHDLTVFVPNNDSIKISRLRLKNIGYQNRKISLTNYIELVLGNQREKTSTNIITNFDTLTGIVYARNPFTIEFANRVTFVDCNIRINSFTCDRKEFLGRNGNYSSPAALKRVSLSGKDGVGLDPCLAIQSIIDILPGEECEIIFLLGQCDSLNEARTISHKYKLPSDIQSSFEQMRSTWDTLLNQIQVQTPDKSFNFMMNGWLLYQTLTSRLWSRTAFYQSGGAYGFRDQLQDCMALVYSAPQLAREHLLRASSRQFIEGDVQHWWHPPLGRGVRTHFSDDLLWLPFVVSFYITKTGDKSILSEMIPFLEAPILEPAQEDSYSLPKISNEIENILTHCIRAIDKSMQTGIHGLPLIGSGDWNDGMNHVGSLGKGESIWLAWFLYKVLEDFIPLLDSNDPNIIRYQWHQTKLKENLELNGWDGHWYRRAFFDDGTPLGSIQNTECQIDSISQSWAVLSKAGNPTRATEAMMEVEKQLILNESQIILLLSPPFDKSTLEPGYIKGYVPGVRENGGQYTHAAIWTLMAIAELGDGNKALQLFDMINPINHTDTKAGLHRYKIEPYVIAADLYTVPPHIGRGGWSWYTGAASWYYRAGLESILGFNLENGDTLSFNAFIVSNWESYKIDYKFKSTIYNLEFLNPLKLKNGTKVIIENGEMLKILKIKLLNDRSNHQVKVKIIDLNLPLA